MSKWNLVPQVLVGVIVGLVVAIIIGGFNYWLQIPLLRSQVDDLRTSQTQLSIQLREIQQKYSRLEGFLEARLNYNYSAFVEISEQKKIPQSEFKAALPILEYKQEQAASYLKNKLQSYSLSMHSLHSFSSL